MRRDLQNSQNSQLIFQNHAVFYSNFLYLFICLKLRGNVNNFIYLSYMRNNTEREIIYNVTLRFSQEIKNKKLTEINFLLSIKIFKLKLDFRSPLITFCITWSNCLHVYAFIRCFKMQSCTECTLHIRYASCTIIHIRIYEKQKESVFGIFNRQKQFFYLRLHTSNLITTLRTIYVFVKAFCKWSNIFLNISSNIFFNINSNKN